MDKYKIIFAAVVIFLLGMSMLIKPVLIKRQVTGIITTVLDLWEANDLSKSFDYWENPEKSPPVYGLLHHEIKQIKIFKENKQFRAIILARLEFPPDNLLPSGKEWVFELNYSKRGWLISDFYQMK